MPITIDGNGTIAGLSSGGIAANTITAATIASGQTFSLNGIAFPATQVASSDANTLDDYEEGTWTPSLGGNTTYVTQIGKYTKVGRMVYVSAMITVNSIGTGSTSQITGLPFTQSGTADAETCWSVASSSTIATSVVSFTVYSFSTTIYVYSRTAAALNESNNAIFKNGATIELAGWYQST